VFVVVVLIVVAIFFGVLVNIRNNMTQKNVKVDEEWSQVQNVYQRRFDLIYNLSESARAYLKLEKDIFKSIADARAGITSGIADAKTPSDLDNATSEISSFVRDLRVVVEDTPELKASETIRDLMNQLEGSENRITVERQRFNEAVGDYNTYIKLWPQSIIASRYGFEPREFFKAEEGAEKAPDINLNIDETTTSK